MSQTETRFSEAFTPSCELEPVHAGLVVGLTSISAGGKSFTAEQLVGLGEVNPHPTDTDRPMRPDETDTPYDHHFVMSKELQRRKRLGEYIVEDTLYGNNYGLRAIPEPELPHVPTLVLVKPQVVPKLRQVLSCVTIYAIESRDGHDRLAARMRERGQTEADIAARIARARDEEAAGREVADPGRLFIADGHPREVLGAIRQALRTDFAAHHQNCMA